MTQTALQRRLVRLAAAMMELHGARLGVSSAPQCGTTVTLTFPASRIGDARNRKVA